MESPLLFSMKTSIWTVFLLYSVVVCCARPYENSLSSEKPDLETSEASDIVLWRSQESSLKSFIASDGSNAADCQSGYGFLPCSNIRSGSAFLLLVYGFIMFMAVEFLTKGSQLLLTVLDPGFVAGIVVPILKTLPATFLIFVAFLAENEEDAHSKALVGMGVLAGTSIALLGIVWGSSIIVGRCDFDSDGVARDKTLTQICALRESGVTTESRTRQAAWIMLFTVLPYLVIQFPVMLGRSDKSIHISVLVAGVLALVTLAGYCIYQMLCPWIQARLIYKAQQAFHRSHHFAEVPSPSEVSWVLADGTPDRIVLEKLFKKLDSDGTGYISMSELRGLILAMGLDSEDEIPAKQVVIDAIKTFDVEKTGKVSREDFVKGMDHLIRSLKGDIRRSHTSAEIPAAPYQEPTIGELITGTKELELSIAALLAEVREDEIREMQATITPEMAIVYAVLCIIAGVAVAGFAAIPTVGVIGDFSKAFGADPFIVSFVAAPLILNLSEGIKTISSAGKRGKLHITTVFAETFGRLTMNNTLSLAIFLAVVYFKGLAWEYPSEVLAILITYVIIGLIASVRTKFPLWIGILAIILYPLMLVILIGYKIICAALTTGIDLKFTVWEGIIALLVYPTLIFLLVVACSACLPRF
ncbi:hypothetical protein MPTK1_5g15310 [Marchantia polymorpha subsp. ruderalis]|uniref:EF-hand domain-containing protein n=2 Tax=Marchantia polymorpha TaxID=3197 RepID=A0AAF6BIM0_MARPO|nr:hypothetical protein MARPO_0071s0079 [Marchantia polymorpha]BBN11854.1 hypothetical protein Mp_5g15310 [Marchantia polymorpha subsp. ruderalis]|eukprot:PTQ35468.1 hypothetical protein MARPO_0071s0079 [Marchantia polymorpha]